MRAKSVKAFLTNNLVYGNGNGVGEIQGANGVPHGDPNAKVPIVVKNVLGESAGFLAFN